MVHQVPEHRRRYSLIRQRLGIGVPEGVRVNAAPVEPDRLTVVAGPGGVEAGDAGHPGSQPHQDLVSGQMGAPVGVLVRLRQQP